MPVKRNYSSPTKRGRQREPQRLARSSVSFILPTSPAACSWRCVIVSGYRYLIFQSGSLYININIYIYIYIYIYYIYIYIYIYYTYIYILYIYYYYYYYYYYSQFSRRCRMRPPTFDIVTCYAYFKKRALSGCVQILQVVSSMDSLARSSWSTMFNLTHHRTKR